MTKITLIHTSPVHVPVFKALHAQLAPNDDLTQIVREDWLTQAQKTGVLPSLEQEIASTIEAAQGSAALGKAEQRTVICTCTTIGAAAAKAGAIRIDAPMMEEAAKIGGPVLLVYALQSTATASTELLKAAFRDMGKDAIIHPLFLGEFWPLFETGEHQAFAACIAGAVRHALRDTRAACVVLAQASMASSATLLDDLATPVLTSPEFALRKYSSRA